MTTFNRVHFTDLHEVPAGQGVDTLKVLGHPLGTLAPLPTQQPDEDDDEEDEDEDELEDEDEDELEDQQCVLGPISDENSEAEKQPWVA